ncbi:hypothetical protein [Mycobacterium palustre]|uniref:hypothetical protein n=1 Tax=Mycobacterium palustre TaxID=153971 RepID=UPI001302BCD0|nr:hypothetical protein [Mycobacterium palustre]MCV7100963.1 hypothetical protein [Mycobacterium palustre]
MKARPDMPNPLNDELAPEAKAKLAAIFAEMRRRIPPLAVNDYDRPHTRTTTAKGRCR